jgi:hypothetical protein
MSLSRQEIEHAFRKLRRQEFLFDLKRSWGAWTLVATLVIGVAYYSVTPRTVIGTLSGTAIGAHLPASEDNSALMRVAVRLDAKRTVNVPVPRHTPYLAGARVEIELIRRDWPPNTITYRFVRYSE